MSREWLQTIAEKVGLTPEQADVRLRRRGIVPNRPPRPAPSIVIERIAFSGEKQGSVSGPIDFDWTGLGPGVWAVTSDRNFAGKSTVLEVVLWCLRGAPKDLQADVRKWLAEVALEFTVDDQAHRVAFRVADGKPNGALERRETDGSYRTLDTFTSDEDFGLVMSKFMMDQLDLDPLPAMQGKEGEKSVVHHGWAALSNAFYFGGDHKVLLGDVQTAGLPARTLGMFVGLPSASTRAFATTAKKEQEQEQDQAADKRKRSAAEAEAARSRLQTDLEAANLRLEKLPAETTSAEALSLAGELVAGTTQQVAELQARAAKDADEAERIAATALADERALRDLRETIVAARFFNGLKPDCCPRCEARVPPTRIRAETADLACSLCSEAIPEDRLEDVSESLEEAEARASASKSAAARADAAATASKKALDAAAGDLAKARSELEQAVRGTDFAARRVAELEVARLEGALQERSSEVAEVEPHPDAALVDAAMAATDKAYKAERVEILEALSAEILRLGQQLGIETLERVELNSNASMKIKKGGADTSFSNVTAGERLRLRLSTAIAALRVGRTMGVGRHPGLLIVDSPADEEVSDLNLQALLGALREIAAETDGLQVILASANPEEIERALGSAFCRAARDDGYVW